ncbi:MAG: PAS domain-containing protein, partial [Planctomycetia bacterium]|nr:PAS domain-containing protein [Planctomycetia bacterium]
FANAALTGFFALAALLSAWHWYYSRHNRTLLAFSIHCALCTVTATCIAGIATATTPAQSETFLHWRVTLGLAGRATTVWLLTGLTGLSVRWYVKPFIAGALLLAAINTLVVPLNASVTDVAQFSLPWGESISMPVRAAAAWWVAPIYAALATVDVFGLIGAVYLSRRDRIAGILVGLASVGAFLSFSMSVLTDLVRVKLPYLGVLPYAVWVGPIALLVLRENARSGERLAASERRFQAIFNQTFQFIGLLKVDGTLIEANRTALEFAGIRQEDVVGKPFWETPWWTHSPELQQRLREAIRQAAVGTMVRFEATHPQPNGEMAHVDFSLKPVRDERGIVTLLIPEGRDITDRVVLEEQLRQSQKMQAIGQLAGGVAHDFNNLLTVIMGCSELLADPLTADDPQREVVDAIQNASSRAALLTRQLLLFSRKGVLEPKIIDINASIQNIADMLRRLIGENVLLTTRLAPGLDRIRSDAGQIEQVIMNLSLNARDAMPAGGRLTLETRSVDVDEPFCRAHPGAIPGRFVLLQVTDTGCGMTPEIKSHLFEPFFTTKPPGEGTGLGLATIYGIVQQNAGFITVSSEVGRGTTLGVYLPVAQTASRASLNQPV